MFALPDYGENTIFPPARTMPTSRVDAICMQMMQKMMADSYIEGRKYWAEHGGGPDEVQEEIEKFLEFTALLPKRARPCESEPAPEESNEESSVSVSTSNSSESEELDIVPGPTQGRLRWKRYLSFSSSPLSPSFLKASSSSSRPRSISFPLVGKVPRPSFSLPKRLRRLSRTITPPRLRRTASEPAQRPTQTHCTPPPKPRRMTLDESQIALARSRISTDNYATARPLSLPSSPRIPRFPCDYLPKKPPPQTRKRRRPAKSSDAKPENRAVELLTIAVPPRPLVKMESDPPIGSPNCVRKFPLPPPEWFDTPFPEEEKPAEDEESSLDDEESMTWYHILLAPFALILALVIALIAVPVFLDSDDVE